MRSSVIKELKILSCRLDKVCQRCTSMSNWYSASGWSSLFPPGPSLHPLVKPPIVLAGVLRWNSASSSRCSSCCRFLVGLDLQGWSWCLNLTGLPGAGMWVCWDWGRWGCSAPASLISSSGNPQQQDCCIITAQTMLLPEASLCHKFMAGSWVVG